MLILVLGFTIRVRFWGFLFTFRVIVSFFTYVGVCVFSLEVTKLRPMEDKGRTSRVN